MNESLAFPGDIKGLAILSKPSSGAHTHTHTLKVLASLAKPSSGAPYIHTNNICSIIHNHQFHPIVKKNLVLVSRNQVEGKRKKVWGFIREENIHDHQFHPTIKMNLQLVCQNHVEEKKMKKKVVWVVCMNKKKFLSPPCDFYSLFFQIESIPVSFFSWFHSNSIWHQFHLQSPYAIDFISNLQWVLIPSLILDLASSLL